jgi:uncharacterized protein (DUF983 family)
MAGKDEATTKSPVSIWKAGLLSLCPNCGQAPLYESLLKIRSECPNCKADFASEDSGDGPAVFVILIAGALIVPVILIIELALKPPVWALVLFALPFTALVCLGLLIPFKSMLFALHWRHRAAKGRKASVKDDG